MQLSKTSPASKAYNQKPEAGILLRANIENKNSEGGTRTLDTTGMNRVL